MIDDVVSRRSTAKSSRNRAVRPNLEGLEDRMLLYATTGDHFVYGSRITWSIMPDGTNIGGGTPSNLISTLNADLGGSPSKWLPAIQDAFAQWENVANVNLVQVPDDGSAFGAGPYQQGAPNVGDIRIGGFVESGNTLAFAILPPTANGGSDAGDILMNTAMPWNINANYDLETVMIHEIGHALGMGHSASTSAAMYPYYGGVQTWLDPDDVAGVQSIWGARQEDLIEQQSGNLTMANAANITGFMTTSNDQIYLPGLDVAKAGETYWFKVTTPSNASTVFTAFTQAGLLSELSPRVAIFNAAGTGLVQTSSPASTYGGTINATITNATPNTTYYVRVQGSNSGDTGTGAYALMINMGTGQTAAAAPPYTTVNAQADQGGGVSPELGGANTPANTPVDRPDRIKLGSIVSNGDDLLAPVVKVATKNHAATHIKAVHPTRHKAAKLGKPSRVATVPTRG